jgi:hypothetical protein
MPLPRYNRRSPALGTFAGGPKLYGFVPAVPRQRGGAGVTPALLGMFRAGPTVGVSQINAIATNFTRGSGR